MTSKQIIDLHYEKNYKYYRQVCYRYYKGKYLFEDLLNESYLEFLKVKEDTVYKFSDLNKLHCIGLKIIRSLYQKRYQSAKNNYTGNGSVSSPLFETPNIDYQIEFLCDDSKDEVQIQAYFEKAISAIEKALQYPVTDEKRTPYQLVQTFLAVEGSNINRISIETGVSRPFITETYKQAKEYLKKEILK